MGEDIGVTKISRSLTHASLKWRITVARGLTQLPPPPPPQRPQREQKETVISCCADYLIERCGPSGIDPHKLVGPGKER